VASNCRGNGFEVNQFVLGENQFSFNIETSEEETVDVRLYDVRGRLVGNQKFDLDFGNNKLELDNLALSRGMYLLSIKGEKNVYSTKLMKQ